jgi:deoxyribonuclease V
MEKFKKEQEELRSKIILKRPKSPIKFIAGCDSSILGENILSVFVIFTYPTLKQIEVVYNTSKIPFPYIPGFLSFREIPNLLKTYKKLKNKPDLIMVDGQGIMHPRRMGLATHLGIKINTPTIGVAKKRLYGKYEMPNITKGSYSKVFDKDEIIGFALRSKNKTNPLFISPGNLCDLETSLEITLSTLRNYKLPETTRIADLLSKEIKKDLLYRL